MVEDIYTLSPALMTNDSLLHELHVVPSARTIMTDI